MHCRVHTQSHTRLLILRHLFCALEREPHSPLASPHQPFVCREAWLTPLLESPAWAPPAVRSAAQRSPVVAVLLELERAAALDRCTRGEFSPDSLLDSPECLPCTH